MTQRESENSQNESLRRCLDETLSLPNCKRNKAKRSTLLLWRGSKRRESLSWVKMGSPLTNSWRKKWGKRSLHVSDQLKYDTSLNRPILYQQKTGQKLERSFEKEAGPGYDTPLRWSWVVFGRRWRRRCFWRSCHLCHQKVWRLEGRGKQNRFDFTKIILSKSYRKSCFGVV